MITRPATAADRPAVTELQRRWDRAWFGAAEHDESEVGEDLDRVDSLAEHSRLVLDGDSVVAAAWWWGNNATLLVDPSIAAAPLHADLLDWFDEQRTPYVDALSTDSALTAALTARGWRPAHSSFELIRAVAPDWALPEPVWADGVVASGYRIEDARAIHHLIYRDARWADVAGHEERDLDEWRSLFLPEATVPEQQVLAWRGDRLVGVALGRTFSDGTGWVTQLAVAADERGHGMGRALLLAALHRRRDAGATALGLAVQAENRGALALYLDVGLTVDREWLTFRAPPDSTKVP